ncbi:unnamed protein product [Orchesella dallaii]|uniref:C2H2-type domain-containing protein n=1 Tax=Orchesella dallaii TaxID=48710 RepID=A0ABP1RWN6_9HEXA
METMRRHIKLHSQKPEDAFPCELCGWIIGGVRGKQLAIDYHNFFIHHIGSNPIKSRGKNKRQRSPSPPLRPPKRPRARVTHPKVFKKKKPPSTSSSSRKLKTKTGNPTIVLVNGVVKNVPVEVQIVDVDPVAVVHNENYPDNDEKEIEQERFFSCDLNPGNVNDEDEYHDDEDVDEPEIKIIKIEDADDDDDYLPTERESQNEGEGNDLDFIPGNIASNPCSYTPIVTESLSGNAVKHYKCLMGCPAQFNKEFKLENHHKLHSPVAKASTCEICGWLVSPSFLKDHMTLNHPFAVKKDLIVKDNEEYTELITVRAGFSRYKCKRCPLHFNHMNQLIPHLELHKPGSGAVRCDICEWVMAPDKLKLHNQNHHPPKKKDRWELRAGPSGVGKPQVEN